MKAAPQKYFQLKAYPRVWILADATHTANTA
jgi:hypothetical protein